MMSDIPGYPSHDGSQYYVCNDLQFNLDTSRLVVAGNCLVLYPHEYALLEYLAVRIGTFTSTKRIAESPIGNTLVNSNSLGLTVRRINARLLGYVHARNTIQYIKNRGYGIANTRKPLLPISLTTAPTAIVMSNYQILDRKDLPKHTLKIWCAIHKVRIIQALAYRLISLKEARDAYGITNEEIWDWYISYFTDQSYREELPCSWLETI